VCEMSDHAQSVTESAGQRSHIVSRQKRPSGAITEQLVSGQKPFSGALIEGTMSWSDECTSGPLPVGFD
jgi:hypothetical protein